MAFSHVLVQLDPNAKGRITLIALIRLLTGMRVHVVFQRVIAGQTDPAILIRALEGTKSSVDLHVTLQHVIKGKFPITMVTFEGPHIGVLQMVVLLQTDFLRERLSTLDALEFSHLPGMPRFVFQIVELVDEPLATDGANVATLALQMLLSVRIVGALPVELFAADFTGQRSLETRVGAPRLCGHE